MLNRGSVFFQKLATTAFLLSLALNETRDTKELVRISAHINYSQHVLFE